MKIDTIVTGGITAACIGIFAMLGRALKAEHDSDEMRIDKWAWLSYGIKKGWIDQYCATHDCYTTEEEDNMFEEYDDPCIPILRMRDWNG